MSWGEMEEHLIKERLSMFMRWIHIIKMLFCYHSRSSGWNQQQFYHYWWLHRLMDSAGQLCWSHWGSLLQLQLDGSWDYDVQNGFIHCLTPWGTAGSPGFTPRFHVIQGFSLRTWPFHMISPAEHLIFLYSSSGIPKVQSGSCLALLRLVCVNCRAVTSALL